MTRIVSGIKPTGVLTLGNYIGAIKQFVKLQDKIPDSELLFFIADLHALTEPQIKEQLKKSKKDLAALYIACGLNGKNTYIFNQSQVIEHSQLGYIMECVSYIGEMERMTQFKDKRVKQVEGVRTSLLTYPALMAADILLYDADLVPVGEDQTQHLELTRNLAERFNSTYGDTFVVPKGLTPETGKKIKNLQDTSKKMSKSDNGSSKDYISLLDNPAEARNKIKSAITDSSTGIYYDVENKPGISNLIDIYQGLTDISREQIVLKYKDASYADFKADLGEIVFKFLTDLQNKYNDIIKSGELTTILENGAKYARYLAKKKIDKVYKKIGLI